MDGGSTGDDVDRISALPDDLLPFILGFLREAAAVTATAALSRRWCRVWTGARDLSLDDWHMRKLKNSTVPGYFAGFVDWVPAQRGDADMDSLRIIMRLQFCPSPDKINGWIRYGMQRVIGEFCLRFTATESEAAVELPSYGRAASISLELSNRGRPRLLRWQGTKS
ncbi:hypothetical protein BAE44_0006353 [Dichanthelium oligosanthes]|uniref:F-box domain-containing protein n=1 Tax=Dichanthelium oligosanthes TaxID=888268 RepID=A0A1E5W5T0_9POAL|nr:hypothetical protein BAE44_0006353 [Dichanthelium oligosanthes]